MNIELENNWLLTSDKNGFKLEKGSVKKYYGSIESSLNGYIKQRILESQSGTLKEILDLIKELENYIKEISGGF